jgi:hypothetical protein
MKRVKYLSLSLCLWTGFSGLETQACSVFTASRVDKVFAATNKDWNNTCTRIRIYAPTEDKFGRLYFGYEVSQGFQNVGGMNEHGLWYDGASLPQGPIFITTITNLPSKVNFARRPWKNAGRWRR